MQIFLRLLYCLTYVLKTSSTASTVCWLVPTLTSIVAETRGIITENCVSDKGSCTNSHAKVAASSGLVDVARNCSE